MFNSQTDMSNKRHSTSIHPHTSLRQEGMTLIGFLIVLSIVIFVAFMGMKIVPVYLDHYSVVQAMKGVQKEPGMAAKSTAKIKDSFFRRLYVSYVDGIEPSNVRVIRANGKTLQVKYDVQKQMVGNIDLLIHFDDGVILDQ